MKTIKKVADTFTGGNVIATSITSSSTNEQVAGAKAVYDFKNTVDVCSIRMANDYTFSHVSGTDTKISFDTLDYQLGDKLTLSNGSIVVGAGVSAVLLTLNLVCKPIVDRENVFFIKKNTANLNTRALFIGMPNSTSITTPNNTMTNGIILYCDVEEGDTLSLYFNSWHSGNQSVTIRTVTVLSAMAIKYSNTTANRSLNMTKSENTGSLVGMGDRAEVSEQVEETDQTRTEVSENEVSGDQIEEKESGKQAKTVEAVST